MLHHLVERLGRVRHQRLAVPQQLDVGRARDAVELALPGRRVDRRLEGVLGGRGLLRRRSAPGSSPPRRTRRSRSRPCRAGPCPRPARRAGGRTGRAGRRRRWAAGCRRSCSGPAACWLQSAMILSKPGAARAAVQVDHDPWRPARAGRERGHECRRAEQGGPARQTPTPLPLSLNPHRPSVQVKRLRSGAAHSCNGHSARTCGRGRDGTTGGQITFSSHCRGARGRVDYHTRPRWARVASISNRWTGSSGGRPDQGISSAVAQAQRVSS